MKLTKTKEEVISRYTLNLNAQGFPPPFYAVRVIANKLLAKRSNKPVS